MSGAAANNNARPICDCSTNPIIPTTEICRLMSASGKFSSWGANAACQCRSLATFACVQGRLPCRAGSQPGLVNCCRRSHHDSSRIFRTGAAPSRTGEAPCGQPPRSYPQH